MAETIGWEAGSPFQLEVAFGNLTLGVLGLIAIGRRDGFREATVLSVTIFGFGATIVHAMDIWATGNMAPGNTVQNFANLLRPALLIVTLTAARRAEKDPSSEAHHADFDRWRVPIAQGAGYATGCVATAFGIGFALGYPALLTILGALLGFVIIVLVLRGSSRHRIGKHTNA